MARSRSIRFRNIDGAVESAFHRRNADSVGNWNALLDHTDVDLATTKSFVSTSVSSINSILLLVTTERDIIVRTRDIAR